MFFLNPRNKPNSQTNIWQTSNLNPATKSNLYQIQKNKKQIKETNSVCKREQEQTQNQTSPSHNQTQNKSKNTQQTSCSHNQTHHHHRLRASQTQSNKPISQQPNTATSKKKLKEKFYGVWVWSRFEFLGLEQIQRHHFCLLKSNKIVSHHQP